MILRPDPNEEFDFFNKLHFDNKIPKIGVYYNERLKTSAGRCRGVKIYKGNGDWNLVPKRIDIHARLFDKVGWDYTEGGNPYSEFRITLLHEMVHAFLWHYHNYNGHGLPFQEKMIKITGVNRDHTFHSLDVKDWKKKKRIPHFNPFRG